MSPAVFLSESCIFRSFSCAAAARLVIPFGGIDKKQVRVSYLFNHPSNLFENNVYRLKNDKKSCKL
ncbi:hypothetical protein DWV16_06855 [Anaerotruncus sp. AF02-27]|nr:hypothetical protein DWV16_06855 [Anaerotruncus sp. AF02-27]